MLIVVLAMHELQIDRRRERGLDTDRFNRIIQSCIGFELMNRAVDGDSNGVCFHVAAD